MGFIEPDEFILLLDYLATIPPEKSFTVDELKRFRDCGVKTVYVNIFWPVIEPAPGDYDWDYSDAVVENIQKAGVKLLFNVPTMGPHFGPDEWYLRDSAGNLWKDYRNGFADGWPYYEISPWNEEAMAYEQGLIEQIRARYPTDLVHLIKGGTHGGEVLLPGMIDCWFDEKAIASFRAFAKEQFKGDLDAFNKSNSAGCHSWDDAMPAMLPNRVSMVRTHTTVEWLQKSLLHSDFRRQWAFAQQPTHEIWEYLCRRDGEFQDQYETGPHSCNWLLENVYQEVPKALNAELNIIQFEAFRPDGDQGIFKPIKRWLDHTWVGSQFCQGLGGNTHKAIDLGLRGFLCAPLHPQGGNYVLEDWMFEQIRWSIGEWRAART